MIISVIFRRTLYISTLMMAIVAWANDTRIYKDNQSSAPESWGSVSLPPWGFDKLNHLSLQYNEFNSRVTIAITNEPMHRLASYLLEKHKIQYSLIGEAAEKSVTVNAQEVPLRDVLLEVGLRYGFLYVVDWHAGQGVERLLVFNVKDVNSTPRP